MTRNDTRACPAYRHSTASSRRVARGDSISIMRCRGWRQPPAAELNMRWRPRLAACGPARHAPTTAASLALERATHKEDHDDLLLPRRLHLRGASRGRSAAVLPARHPGSRQRSAAPPGRESRSPSSDVISCSSSTMMPAGRATTPIRLSAMLVRLCF